MSLASSSRLRTLRHARRINDPRLSRLRAHPPRSERYLCLLGGPGVIAPGHELREALESEDTPDIERVQALLLHVAAARGQVRLGKDQVFLHDLLQASLEVQVSLCDR